MCEDGISWMTKHNRIIQHNVQTPYRSTRQGPPAQRAVFLQSASETGKTRLRLLHATARLPYSTIIIVIHDDFSVNSDPNAYNMIPALV
jgi:hypothetical protein